MRPATTRSLIETVGAGQSEVEVARLAETTVVVEVPEMGDEVQAIKAGLLEVADIIAVNKGDRPGADRAARQLRAMLSTAGGRVERKPPPVLMTTATTADGRRGARRRDRGASVRRRERRSRPASGRPARCDGHWPTLRPSRRGVAALGGDADAVADRELDPITAAERLLGLARWLGANGHRVAAAASADHERPPSGLHAWPSSRGGPFGQSLADTPTGGQRATRATPTGRIGGWYASAAMSIDRVFVIGAGLMGHGIAQVSAAAGKRVTLADRTAELAEKGAARIAGNLERQVDKGKLEQAAASAILDRISTAEGTDAAAGHQIVIEAVFEDEAVKRETWQRLTRGG